MVLVLVLLVRGCLPRCAIVHQPHDGWPGAAGMMLGIYTSVVNTTIGAEKLVLDDFFYVRKLLFPPAGSTSTPPHTLPQVSASGGVEGREPRSTSTE